MSLWNWLCSQAVPGMVLAGWIGSISIGSVIHRITERRHRERIAALHEHAEAMNRLTAQLARSKD